MGKVTKRVGRGTRKTLKKGAKAIAGRAAKEALIAGAIAAAGVVLKEVRRRRG